MTQLAVRSIGRIQLVDVGAIDWLAGAGNYVEIHTDGATMLHRESLYVIEQRLDPRRFVRIHRSAVVNRRAVREVGTDGRGRVVVTRDGRVFRVSRSCLPAIDRLLYAV